MQFWPNVRFPRDWQTLHLNTSSTTPFLIPEFQGGSGTGWGPFSVNQDACAALVGPEAIRVLYKNNWSFGTKLLNVYMTFGGTNWGNLGYEGGDSSYDYGAAIDESRGVGREKFSEEKVEAYFLKVSLRFILSTIGQSSPVDFIARVSRVCIQLLTYSFHPSRSARRTSLPSPAMRATAPRHQRPLSPSPPSSVYQPLLIRIPPLRRSG